MKITVSSCDNVAVPDWIYWLVTDRGDYLKVQIGFDASAKEILRRLTEPSK